MDLVLNLLVVSRPIKPSDLRLFAEPRHLTLCIASGVSLDYTNRFVPWDTGIDVRYDMPVPYRFKRLHAGRNSISEQLSDFLDKTRLKHPVDALIDSFVQLVSGRV